RSARSSHPSPTPRQPHLGRASACPSRTGSPSLLRGCPPGGLALSGSRTAPHPLSARRTGGTVQNARGMTSSRRWRSGAGVALVLIVVVTVPAHARSEADERAAKRVEAMASFLAKAPRLSVTVDSSYDVVQDSGEKIEFGEIRTLALRRPDRVRIDTT